MTSQELFDRLWADYTENTPSAREIYELFTKAGERVVNDHIAYRTVDLPEVNINVLAKAFIAVGYEPRAEYSFPEKHLVARHFEHANFPDAPRVFISQLVLSDFSNELQQIFKDAVAAIAPAQLQAENLVLAGTAWGLPDFQKYEALRRESEYAAWLYAFGFRANHFTVSINELKHYHSIEKVNQFLKENGFALNTSGGEIKGTREELLRQSSILARKQAIQFTDGPHAIPGCYYEFAERHPDAQGRLYSGFIAQSADKIFESTNFYN